MKSISKAQIDNLVKLQKIEMQVGRINSILNDLPERLGTLDTRLKAFESTIKEKEADVCELKQNYRSKESDLQMNMTRIEKNQENLRAVKTNKEYRLLLKEIETIKRQNSQIEDEILQFLDRIDEEEKNISVRTAEYLQIKEQITAEKDAIKQEAELEKKNLVSFDEELNTIYAKIDAGLLKKYNLIRDRVVGPAVAPARHGVCQGCHMNIPSQMYSELQGSKALMLCPHCQRIIYWEEEEKVKEEE
jgi:predicted  nucleic acid-binding Zn-ribbon protein